MGMSGASCACATAATNINPDIYAHAHIYTDLYAIPYTDANALKECTKNVSSNTYQTQEHDSLALQLYPAASSHLNVGLFATVNQH